jgi:hypothetical protein
LTELLQGCAHFDRAKLTPVRRFVPHGGLVLKVNSVDIMLARRHVQHSLAAGAGRRGRE